jgi:hypothetical protein
MSACLIEKPSSDAAETFELTRRQQCLALTDRWRRGQIRRRRLRWW